MRIIGIDRGDKRIGLAVSDETGLIANPVKVIEHISLAVNAAEITLLAKSLNAEVIVIGVAKDGENQLSPSGRKSIRLGEEIERQSGLPVKYMDEYGSTRLARDTALEMGLKRSKRGGHRDDVAAVIILQSYLDQMRGGE
jgi:putative holliday junction resolvase